MSVRIFDYPTSRIYLPERCDMTLDDGVRVNDNPFTGSIKTHETVGSHRWRMSVTWVPHRNQPRGEVGAFLRGIGRSNRVRMWNHARPQPLGTLTGAPTLASAAARGDLGLTIAVPGGQSGATLEAGDFFSVGGQLFEARVRAVQVGSGIDVECNPPVAQPIGVGTLVTLIRPTAVFLMLSPVLVPHTFGHSPAFSAEFREQ